jgi:hypothetical protein
MARHLAEHEILDALEERARPDLREHLESCRDCAAAVALANEGLSLAREAEVPEPSPLYWEAFRRQVDRRIDSEPAPRRWPWLLPVATAAAVALLALPLLRSRSIERASPAPPRLPAWSSLPPSEEDDGLAVLEGVSLAESDLVSVREGRSVDDVLTDLSDDETAALTEALRHELKAGRL